MKTWSIRTSASTVRISGRGTWLLAAAGLAATMALAGCGGGGDGGVAVFPVVIDVSGGGRNPARAVSGAPLATSADVGQPIEFDANEAVTWSFSVNGSPLSFNGTTVDVGGITITQTQVGPSRLILQSKFSGPAVPPINLVVVATSTIDTTNLATIYLFLGGQISF